MQNTSSDDELRLNRRRFLQYAAATTAVTASVAAIAMKTDALADVQQQNVTLNGGPGGGERYQYSTP